MQKKITIKTNIYICLIAGEIYFTYIFLAFGS